MKIALQLAEEHPIERNRTILVIGQILHIFLREDILEDDGFVAHQKADSLAVAGLDAYFGLKNGQRFSYAKPDQPIRKTIL